MRHLGSTPKCSTKGICMCSDPRVNVPHCTLLPESHSGRLHLTCNEVEKSHIGSNPISGSSESQITEMKGVY